MSMSSKTALWVCALCAGFIFVPVIAGAQTENQKPISLADLARQQRAKNNKDDKQKGKVYSNEDLPEHPSDAKPTKSAEVNSDGGKEAEKENTEADAKPKASSSEPHDEKYFRKRMDEFRSNLESDKKRLAAAREAKDEHEKDIPLDARIVRHSDPNAPNQNTPVIDAAQAPPAVEAGESVAVKKYNSDQHFSKDAWQTEERRLNDNIRSQENNIATDEEKISTLVIQCRHENCQPGWIR